MSDTKTEIRLQTLIKDLKRKHHGSSAFVNIKSKVYYQVSKTEFISAELLAGAVLIHNHFLEKALYYF